MSGKNTGGRWKRLTEKEAQTLLRTLANGLADRTGVEQQVARAVVLHVAASIAPDLVEAAQQQHVSLCDMFARLDGVKGALQRMLLQDREAFVLTELREMTALDRPTHELVEIARDYLEEATDPKDGSRLFTDLEIGAILGIYMRGAALRMPGKLRIVADDGDTFFVHVRAIDRTGKDNRVTQGRRIPQEKVVIAAVVEAEHNPTHDRFGPHMPVIGPFEDDS